MTFSDSPHMVNVCIEEAGHYICEDVHDIGIPARRKILIAAVRTADDDI